MPSGAPSKQVGLDSLSIISYRLRCFQNMKKASKKLFGYPCLTIPYQQGKVVEEEGVISPYNSIPFPSKPEPSDAQVYIRSDD